MFSLNGLDENIFVQPTSIHTEFVFAIQRRHSIWEIREALFVNERFVDCEIGLENVSVVNVKATLQAVLLIMFTLMKHHILL